MTDSCRVIIPIDSLGDYPDNSEIKHAFERGSDPDKILALKKLLILMANGEQSSDLLMFVIRFLFSSKNKTIKKLLLLYLEQCTRTHRDGKLKQEMILICNALRNDLNHANEYVRGMTLRFLARLHEPDLLDSLIPSIRANLVYRHPYVRKNALIAITLIFLECPQLIPDAPDLISNTLASEADPLCRQTALFCLTRISLSRALEYFRSIIAHADTLDEPTQQGIIDFIRHYADECSENERQVLIQTILAIVQNSDSTSSIRYIGASLLLDLSDNSNVIRNVARYYIELANKESDNNVRMLILDKLGVLFQKHKQTLQTTLPDVLTGLSTFDIDSTKKVIEIVSENINRSNCSGIANQLKGQLKSAKPEIQPLILTGLLKCVLHSEESVIDGLQIIIQHMKVAVKIVPECNAFLKSSVLTHPSKRNQIVQNLLSTIDKMRNSKLLRTCLWILGEYIESDRIPDVVECIENLVKLIDRDPNPRNIDSSPGTEKSTIRVLEDGTYASISEHSEPKEELESFVDVFHEQGNGHVAVSISMVFTKILIKGKEAGIKSFNQLRARCLLCMVRMVKSITESSYIPNPDSLDQLFQNMDILLHLETLVDTHGFLTRKSNILPGDQEKRGPEPVSKIFSIPRFSIFKEHRIQRSREIPVFVNHRKISNTSRLDRVVQLTGLGDPIYVEVCFDLDDLDMVLDIVMINRTDKTFQNLLIEFVSPGGNRAVFRPPKPTLGSFATMDFQASIKILSPEQTIIQGCLFYDPNDHIVLNTIPLDVHHFLLRSKCERDEFVRLWRVLEWENKISIEGKNKTFRESVCRVLDLVDFECVRPTNLELLSEDTVCSVNLYASSKFGSPVLANMSMEKTKTGVAGHVRIRSRHSSLAYIVGTKISSGF